MIVFNFLAPKPSSSMKFDMSTCNDSNLGSDRHKWFYIRPEFTFNLLIKSGCNHIESFKNARDAKEIVFVAQMPHHRVGVQLEYSRWFQFLLGLLDIRTLYGSHSQMPEEIVILLDVRLGYRTHKDPENVWHELAAANTTRTLRCKAPELLTCQQLLQKQEGHTYDCDTLDLFELGSNPYPFYLLNIRLPVDREACRRSANPAKLPNCALAEIDLLTLIEIHQNGGFTAIWLGMKTFIFPFVLAMLIWYWRRISALPRFPYLVEKAIFVLGLSLAILDFPMEWLSLWFKIPFLLFVTDIKQGLFYAVLFGFWLVFAGEHLIDDTSRNNLTAYWRNLSSVLVASLCFLIYDIAERGMQLADPFFNIWSSENGTTLAYTMIYTASFATVVYFGFLFYKVILVWMTVKRKRAAQLYRTSETRRLKVESIIYRFKFLMCFTLVCAAFTIVSYLLKQHGEGQIHGDDYSESILTNSTSAFFTGTFGMWNIYVLLLLSMYAPSYKRYGASIG
uniref:Protein wntless n=1 Tax=Syphacia muris TaxID=451379 RepID=A0A0N5B0S1_9BILA